MTRAERIYREHRVKVRNYVAKHAQRSGAGRHCEHKRKEQRDLLRLTND